MAAEFATSTRHHQISAKNQMKCVSHLIDNLSRHIKWLLRDKNASRNNHLICLSICQLNLRQEFHLCFGFYFTAALDGTL